MPPGRPAQFDREDVLARAMDFFWTSGYDGGSISELLSHVGVGRQTIYNTFGSKRGLFIAVIEHYRQTQLSRVLGLLARGGSPLQNIRDAIRFFERLALDKRARGCLVANALVEVGGRDAKLSAILDETLGMLQSAVRDALRSAQASGELPAEKNPKALSAALTNAMVGMAVTGRLGKSKASLSDISAGTMAMLG